MDYTDYNYAELQAEGCRLAYMLRLETPISGDDLARIKAGQK